MGLPLDVPQDGRRVLEGSTFVTRRTSSLWYKHFWHALQEMHFTRLPETDY